MEELLLQKSYLNSILKEYNVWWLVLVAVILALGATLFIGMTIWCVTNGHGTFTGSWSWETFYQVWVSCSW